MNFQEIYDELDRILYQCEEFDCMKKRLEELKSEIGYELYKEGRKRLPTRESKSDEEGLVRENQGCIVLKKVGKYGPYKWRVVKKNGKQTWKYLGKAEGI